ncbi:WD-repeat-containing protein [Ephemerocybe angulata]|uniref:WD-repeat-containing protein n=1 Tax=Ephemerocybe angulata TaxID=980116 RepID=A0A8H6IF13_9AGAR|nr:WD-repeat-containing protein [Tulosesus angulatus]
MSYKKSFLFPANPTTARGSSTKLSSNKDKVVYASGKTVIVRDLKSPALTTVYNGHIQNTTVARISPSGYYCASADAVGNVRVWDVVGEEQILKGEYRVLSGRINDLSWDGESKRIVAVGDGRDKFGHAFMMDSGSSTGEIIGHSKAINAVAIRHQRPFRAATAGDDATIIFHSGVPFKYDKTIKTHTKFVQDVQFSPSGDQFVSVGSDSKIFLYDGKTGETLAEVTESPHKGSIMAASWSADSKSVVTSSADCTVKLWDAETQKAVTSWTVGSGVDHQQTGNTWNDNVNIVSLSLSGDLNVFDPRVGDKPTRVFSAPQKAVTSIISTKDDTFFAGSADGRVYSYSITKEDSSQVGGEGHPAVVTGIAASPSSDLAYSVGYDDHVRELDTASETYQPAAVKTAAQPKSIAATDDGSLFVAETELVEVFRSNQKVTELKPKSAPTAVAASGSTVAIGAENNKTYLFTWSGKELSEIGVLEKNTAPISVLAFSPDGTMLAAGDTKGKIVLYNVSKQESITSHWGAHTSRVNSLSWTANSQNCASGSLDTNVYVWSVAKPLRRVAIKEASGPGGVNAVQWLAGGKDGVLVSSGADAVVRVWSITFPPVN